MSIFNNFLQMQFGLDLQSNPEIQRARVRASIRFLVHENRIKTAKVIHEKVKSEREAKVRAPKSAKSKTPILDMMAIYEF
jgi:ribosomal protein L19E